MFVEEIEEIRFGSNKGRDEFIDEVLDALDKKVTPEDIEEISELLSFS